MYYCSNCGGLISSDSTKRCPNCNIRLSGTHEGSSNNQRQTASAYRNREEAAERRYEERQRRFVADNKIKDEYSKRLGTIEQMIDIAQNVVTDPGKLYELGEIRDEYHTLLDTIRRRDPILSIEVYNKDIRRIDRKITNFWLNKMTAEQIAQYTHTTVPKASVFDTIQVLALVAISFGIVLGPLTILKAPEQLPPWDNLIYIGWIWTILAVGLILYWAVDYIRDYV